jgi:hypothetical protein
VGKAQGWAVINMNTPDMSKVIDFNKFIVFQADDREVVSDLIEEARRFLRYYNWCGEIVEEYVGLLYPGIVGVFLFRIVPTRKNVDEWIWVIVGDLPPAYLTCDQCPNPATALDGYIGAMTDWVVAAEEGRSIDDLIPVNVPANKENAKKLKSRLVFLDENILKDFVGDLK